MTDAEIIELYQLLNYDALTNFDESTNPNYKYLYESLSSQKYSAEGVLEDGFRGVALEGSSRSGKTWSGVDLIIHLCTNVEDNCTINIYRETYNEFKTTLYDDFKRRLDDFGIPNPFKRKAEISSFKINNNIINFLGDGKEGGGCDYAFFNEIMFIKQRVFDAVEMRCRKFWWADYNPSFSDHWFFDAVVPRPDVGFLRTTFEQNPHISHQEKNKILGYEPWMPGSYSVIDSELIFNGKVIDDKNQPPIHPTNLKDGTANEFMWRVYGLGLRGSMKGVIIENLTWIDRFPDIDYTYANDFGFTTDPNALVKYAEDEENIWFELLFYDPVSTDSELATIFESVGVDKDKPIACDSSDKYTAENKGTIEMVKGLKKRGYPRAYKISKTKSVVYWLGSMKAKKLHCVKNHLWKHVKRERENYKWKEVNGIMINQPADNQNHVWDAVRYGHISHNQKTIKSVTTKSLSELGIAY